MEYLNLPRIQLLVGWLVALLLLAGCEGDPYQLRLPQGGGECAVLALQSQAGPSTGRETAPVPSVWSLLQGMVGDRALIGRAVKAKPVNARFFQRKLTYDALLPDEEFPLAWNIDTAHIQTVGLFLVHFEEGRWVGLEFGCKGCLQLLPDGTVDIGDPQRPVEVPLAPDGRFVADGWAFTAHLRHEIERPDGDYVVEVLGHDAYVNRIAEGIELAEVGPVTELRAHDESLAAAKSLVERLAGTMLAEDAARQTEALDKPLRVLEDEIDSAAAQLNELYLALEDFKGGNNMDMRKGSSDDPKNRQRWTQLQAELSVAEKEWGLLMERKIELAVTRAAALPRIRVLDAHARRCGE